MTRHVADGGKWVIVWVVVTGLGWLVVLLAAWGVVSHA